MHLYKAYFYLSLFKINKRINLIIERKSNLNDKIKNFEREKNEINQALLEEINKKTYIERELKEIKNRFSNEEIMLKNKMYNLI